MPEPEPGSGPVQAQEPGSAPGPGQAQEPEPGSEPEPEPGSEPGGRSRCGSRSRRGGRCRRWGRGSLGVRKGRLTTVVVEIDRVVAVVARIAGIETHLRVQLRVVDTRRVGVRHRRDAAAGQLGSRRPRVAAGAIPNLDEAVRRLREADVHHDVDPGVLGVRDQARDRDRRLPVTPATAHRAVPGGDSELQPCPVCRDRKRGDAAFREVVQRRGMMQLPDQVARDARARDVDGQVEVGVHPGRLACVVLRGETADGPGVGPDVGARDVEARRVGPFPDGGR